MVGWPHNTVRVNQCQWDSLKENDTMMNDDEDDKNKMNYGKSALHEILENISDRGLPKGWRQTPLGKQAYQIGHKDGWCEGYEKAMEENQKTLDTIRHLLDLEQAKKD